MAIAYPICDTFYSKVLPLINVEGWQGLVLKLAVDQLAFGPFLVSLYLFVLSFLEKNDV